MSIQEMIYGLAQRMTALETQMRLIFWGISAIGGIITVYVSTRLTIHIRNGNGKKKKSK